MSITSRISAAVAAVTFGLLALGAVVTAAPAADASVTVLADEPWGQPNLGSDDEPWG